MGLGKFLVFMFILLSILTLYIYASTSEHEYLHQLIFEKYGINSTIHYNFWPAFKEQINPANWDKNLLDMEPLATTNPIAPNITNSSQPYPDCNEMCEMEHTMVEIVDHSASNIALIMFVIFMLYVIYDSFFRTNIKEEYKQAIREEIQAQELQLLKDEYLKLTGKKWTSHVEYLEDDDASNKTSDGNKQNDNSVSSDTLDSNRYY